MTIPRGLASSDLASVVDSVDPVVELAALLQKRRFVALTGAGCSTESGIPDYRGEGRTGPRRPILHDAFLKRPEVRQRYWARSTLGWPRFSAAAPNPAHRALVRLEQTGWLQGIITQNVDRLHHAAGSQRVVELHGALADVRCLGCRALEGRDSVQARLLAANPDWLARGAAVAPDGDADLPEAEVATFRVIACVLCGGVLMPNVVFFGGNVPEPTLRAAWELFATAEFLLVVGSSLTVYSGFRFVRRAAEMGVPVGVINLGPTRADDTVVVRLADRAGQALPRLATLLLDATS